MYLLTANLCIYSQPIYWIFRSPWQLMPSFSTESLNQWGPLAFCRYLINVLTRDEWGWVFVTGRAGRDGAGRGTYCLYQLIEIICYTRGNLDWHCRKLVSQIYSTFIVIIVIMLFSVVVLFLLSWIGNIREGNLYLSPRFWEGSPRRGGASIAGPFGNFAPIFLGLFKTMTMTFLAVQDAWLPIVYLRG